MTKLGLETCNFLKDFDIPDPKGPFFDSGDGCKLSYHALMPAKNLDVLI